MPKVLKTSSEIEAHLSSVIYLTIWEVDFNLKRDCTLWKVSYLVLFASQYFILRWFLHFVQFTLFLRWVHKSTQIYLNHVGP
jgi:hypothetical protein